MKGPCKPTKINKIINIHSLPTHTHMHVHVDLGEIDHRELYSHTTKSPSCLTAAEKSIEYEYWASKQYSVGT